MELFNGVIRVSGVPFMMLFLMVIIALGYMLGRITIKGISLGTAGVFVIALLFGALFYDHFKEVLGSADQAKNALKITENMGLVFFITSVGFIAGPKFFKNLKKNFKSYIFLGVSIILAGGLSCVVCYFVGRGFEEDPKEFVAILDGLLSGSLTTTPGFTAAKDTVVNFYASNPELAARYESAVAVGYGIAYLFGVVGVVLFVQLIPKLTKADMQEERNKITSVDFGSANVYSGKLIEIDDMGLCSFAAAALVGLVLGNIRIPLSGKGLDGICFSLTTTGGTLVSSLVFGHFSRIGRINLMPSKTTLKTFREMGLMLFLAGAGIGGGADFVKFFKPIYFLYGAVMTIMPLIIGFLIAKFVLKLPLLNSLGSITGGMTSTPALGTLINVCGTEDVASAYAATYPISLLAVVLVSQFLIILFG